MVVAADVAAQAAGLRVGMPATKAQVLVPGLLVQDAAPAADVKRSTASRSGSCNATPRSPPPIRPTGSSSIRPVPIICMAANRPCWRE